MRLTLRTLLAYMDDILDPADQEELGRKIEASPFATELIHRSRDAVRRLRLSAPEVLAGEEGDLHGGDNILDANTAAEYLDSVLTPDEVVEFERHCLEAGPNADMLLAEAASCHHILTLVLGEPAEVDADLRQRMYALVRHAAPQQLRVEPAHTTPTASAPVLAVAPPAQVPAPAVVFPQRPAIDPDEAGVPDYMLEAARARRRTRWLVATLFLGAVSGALFGGFATWLFWPGADATPPDLAAVGGEKAANDGFEIGGEPTAPATSATTETEEPAEMPPVDGGSAPPFNPGTATATTPAPLLPEANDPSISDAPASAGGTLPPDAGVAPLVPAPPLDAMPLDATTPAPIDTPPGNDALAVDPAPPAATNGGAVAPPLDMTTVPPDAPMDSSATADLTAGGAAPPLADAAIAPPGNDLLAGVGTTAPPTETQPGSFGEGTDELAPTDVEPAEPEAPRQLGAYLGLNNDLLLRYDDAGPQSAWLRLPPRSTFIAGDRLLTLPAFRTHVVLNPDVNAYLGGGTEITLLDHSEGGGDVNVAIPYGRVIFNSGPNGNRIAIVMGDQTRVIALGPASSLAVEVVREFIPGNDFATIPAPLRVSWYLTTGKAEWGEESTVDAPGQTAEAPATWTTMNGVDAIPQTIDELPSWIDKEPTTTLEASARDDIAETVAAGQPVNSALLELTTNSGLGRRLEVRSLAARGATYVGEFEPLVKALADPLERATRAAQVNALRDAIARDPANIERIRAAFELQRGANAAEDLTEMVIGFSAEQIGRTRDQVKEGSMIRLINWLNDEDLAYRVLASHNLNEITGTKLAGYRPEHTASQRQREIQIYLRRFEAGDLMPRQ